MMNPRPIPPPPPSIALGVRYLDTLLGPTWDRWIDLDTLELSNANSCILGQLDNAGVIHSPGSECEEDDEYNGFWPDYTRAVDRLGLSEEELRMYGFTVLDGTLFDTTWDQLNADWREYLAVRQGVAAPPTS